MPIIPIYVDEFGAEQIAALIRSGKSFKIANAKLAAGRVETTYRIEFHAESNNAGDLRPSNVGPEGTGLEDQSRR